MKRLRYSRLLPLLHLLLSVVVIYPQQHERWPYLKNIPPVDEPEFTKSSYEGFGPMPCYEYRPSIADRFAIGVELPVGLPLGLDGGFRGCGHGLIAPVFRKLRMGAKTGTVFLDLILAISIAGEWWLLGWRIDSLHKKIKPAWIWLVPSIIISVAGCLMVPAGLAEGDLLGLIAFLASVAAFFTWIFLLLVALAMGIIAIFRSKLRTITPMS